MTKGACGRLLVTAIMLTGLLSGVAHAGISNSRGSNVEQGNNRSRQKQGGADASGDAIGGQVAGVNSAGTTSVNAHNESTNAAVDSGDATASNRAGTFVGHDACSTAPAGASDIVNLTACTVQESDNRATATQIASASSGDAVGGQVIGAVVSAEATADIVAANTTAESDIQTGDALALNALRDFVGQRDHFRLADTADIRGVRANIVQQGDNRLGVVERADATSGKGIGGQVIGLVAAGPAVIDARNLTQEADVATGVAEATNDESVFVGLEHAALLASGSDLRDVTAFEIQQGDNRAHLGKDAAATSGTALGGQVSAVVVSAGGSVNAVLDQTGWRQIASSGDTTFSNTGNLFVGLRFATGVPD